MVLGILDWVGWIEGTFKIESEGDQLNFDVCAGMVPAEYFN